MHFKKSALIASFVLLAAGARSAPLSHNYCSCLQSANHAANGRRDGAFGVSIVVPARAKKTFPELVEGEAVLWSYRKAEISYGYYRPLSPVSYDHPSKEECLLDVNHRRVLVENYDREGKHEMDANFEMPKKRMAFGLDIRANDRETACSMGAQVIWSAVFGEPSMEALRILSISSDRKSFQYENAPGAVMEGRVGDAIFRGYTKVKSISDSSIVVTDVEPDGLGGWNQIERILPLRKRNDTK